LVPVLLVSFYFSVVPSVELAYGGKLLRSVALFDGEGLEPSSNFEISDVIVFRIDSSWANWYSLVVSNVTCDVYAGSGGLDRLNPEVRLALYPPLFHAKTAYAYQLRVSAFNYPLPGGCVSDSMIGTFLVGGTRADLRLNVTYNDESHELSMKAALVNGDSEPVVNQTVSFFLQTDGNDTSLPDRGWVPLGSSVTDGAGRAALNVVYSRVGGCHKVQARFTGEGFANATADALFTCRPQTPHIELYMESYSNGSKLTAGLTGDDRRPLTCRLVCFQFDGLEGKRYAFSDIDGLASVWIEVAKSIALGEESVTVTVAGSPLTAERTVSSRLSRIASRENPVQHSRTSSPRFDASISGEVGEIVVTANTTRWFALMDNTLYCYFMSDVDLGPLNLCWERGESLLGHTDNVFPFQWTHYVYVGYLHYTPSQLDELGNQTIWVYMIDQEAELVAQGSIAVQIDRTPCNNGILYSSAFVNGNLGLMLSFALPRTYCAVNSCPYVYTYRLAPQVSHDNVNYMVDDLTLQVPVFMQVYVNGVWKAGFPVSGHGLATVPLPLDSEELVWQNGRTYIDLKVVVDPGVTAQTEIQRFITLTENWITSSAVSSSQVGYSSSILGLDDTNRTYTLANATIETCASLFGDPLMNLSTTNVFGRLRYRLDAIRDLPDWSYSLTRFRFFYNATTSTGPAVADIRRDGTINIFDMTKLTGSGFYGKTIESVENWTLIDDCDTNGDGVLNLFDLTKITINYGKKVYYLEIGDPSSVLVKFYNSSGKCFGQSYLDIQGCVMLPSATRNFTLHWNGKRIGATYEQFSDVSVNQGCTDFTGKFRSGFSPSSKGVWLAQSKATSFTAIHVQSGIRYDPGLALTGRLNVIRYFCVVRCPTRLTIDYFPKNMSAPADVTCVVNLFNGYSGAPVGQAPVKITLWKRIWGGTLLSMEERTVYTNRSGIGVYYFGASQAMYKVVFVYDGNLTFLGSSGVAWVDMRLFSSLEVKVDLDGNGVPEALIGNHTATSLGSWVNYRFSVNALPKKNEMGSVKVYVDGSLKCEVSDTGAFDWMAPGENTYYMHIVYTGGESTRPCQLDFMVKAVVLPLLIHFDASPTKFKPGDTVHLHAFAVVADTNQTFMGGLTFKFLQDGAYPPFRTITVPSGQICEASADWSYPSDDNAHTVTVSIEYAGGTVKYMVEPISLEVYRDTKLLFWVERDNSSRHIFHGKLVTTEGVAVQNQTIKAYLNDTQIETGLTTDENGCFTFERNFNPSDQKVTYTVQVAFEGTGNVTATLTATALDGTRYTVCQTTQFNHKPSANMTTIIVEPQATQVNAPAKTPEEIQQEAKQSPWFKIEPEFSWWFPWFRLHFKLDVDLPQGNPKLDHGWSGLPGGESNSADNAVLANVMNDASSGDNVQELIGLFVGCALPFIIQAGVAYFLGRSGTAIIVASVFYGVFLAAQMIWLYLTSAKTAKTWLMAFMSVTFVLLASLAIPEASGVVGFWKFLTTTSRIILQKIQYPLQSLHAMKMNFFDITSAIFALMDFAVMVVYLTVYLSSI
jgi:hypothetical protein